MNISRIITLAALVITFTTTAQAATDKVSHFTLQRVIEASLNGKKELIVDAQKQGFDFNMRDPEQRTPIMYAAFNARTDLVKLMINAGADVNAQDKIGTSALMYAASAPHGIETIKLLLKSGAKINMVDTNEHFSALMWAAAEGQLENVKLLLKEGANLSFKDVDGDTAESFAAKAGHKEIAQLLKKAAEK